MSLHRTTIRLAGHHRSSSSGGPTPTPSYVVGEPKQGILFGAFISKRGKSDSLFPGRVDDFETMLNRRTRVVHIFYARGDTWPISQQDTLCNGTGRIAMCTWQPNDQGSKITINGSPTGGSFTLTYSGQTTASIAYNATAADVKAALEALSNLASGDVFASGNAGGPYTVGLTPNHSTTTITASAAGLTGGSSPSITITRIGTLASINNGYYDAYLRTRAAGCAAKNYDILLRPMHEMNGNWEVWSASTTSLPSGTQTAADFIQAWQRVWGIFRGQNGGTNCTNVGLVWCPGLSDIPNTSGNHMQEYYPGDAYVDWAAVDGYNWGALSTTESSISSSNAKTWDDGSTRTFATFYSMFPNKPLMWGEIGSADDTQSGTLTKAAWYAGMQSGVQAYPRLKSIIYFNAAKERNWQMNSTSLTTVTGSAKDVTTINVTSNVATVTTSSSHGYTTGQTVYLMSCDTDDDSPEYNGAHVITSTPTSTTFTFALTHADATATNVGGLVSRNNWPQINNSGTTAIAARTMVNDPYFLARPAAAITFRNRLGTQTASTSTTAVITTGASVSSGYSIVVVAYMQATTAITPSVTDSVGNTYSVNSTTSNTGNGVLIIASAHNVTALASGGTITVTSSSSQTLISAAALSFDGLATSATFDVQAGQAVSLSTNWSSATTATTAQATELAIGAFAAHSNDGAFAMATNTYWDQVANVAGVNGGTSVQLHVFCRILTATGTQNISGTLSTAHSGTAAVATYKGA